MEGQVALETQVREAFCQRYGVPPSTVVAAPGRVNLIGEHTDYNAGYVMPLAIDRAVWIALRPAAGRQVNVHSLDYNGSDTFNLDRIDHAAGSWAEYVRGVAWALADRGYQLNGWEGVMAGDVPLGAGLSSSAALELAVARAFASASGWPWEATAMARVGQYAENRWVGMNCGIMDQMISAAGLAGHALLIDCRSLESLAVPLPASAAVVVLDTSTRRGLVDSAYNERRSQCEAAARFFGVRALRDVTLEALEQARGQLDDLTYRRARHVISENDRVVAATSAMRRNDPKALGKLLDASHASLRDDFEVSGPALDAIVRCARDHGACFGARMTGAGFGGCAVALVRADMAEDFETQVSAAYTAETGLQPQVYVCRAADGAHVVNGS
jgi:galactokinase